MFTHVHLSGNEYWLGHETRRGEIKVLRKEFWRTKEHLWHSTGKGNTGSLMVQMRKGKDWVRGVEGGVELGSRVKEGISQNRKCYKKPVVCVLLIPIDVPKVINNNLILSLIF